MEEKLTISDFGIDQSQQFEQNKQLAPQQFLQDAQLIYNRAAAPISKGVYLSELDTLFDLKEGNRSFANFSFPQRIKEAFFAMHPGQPMKTIHNLDTIARIKDKIRVESGGDESTTADLKQTFDVAGEYLKDALYARSVIISIGKG
jgi:hypothetical protein